MPIINCEAMKNIPNKPKSSGPDIRAEKIKNKKLPRLIVNCSINETVILFFMIFLNIGINKG